MERINVRTKIVEDIKSPITERITFLLSKEESPSYLHKLHGFAIIELFDRIGNILVGSPVLSYEGMSNIEKRMNKEEKDK